MPPQYITTTDAVNVYTSLSSVCHAIRQQARSRGIQPGDLFESAPMSTFNVEMSAVDFYLDLPHKIRTGPHKDVAFQVCRNVIRRAMG